MEEINETTTTTPPVDMEERAEGYSALAEVLLTMLAYMTFETDKQLINEAIKLSTRIHMTDGAESQIFSLIDRERTRILNTFYEVGELHVVKGEPWMTPDCSCLNCRMLFRAKMMNRRGEQGMHFLGVACRHVRENNVPDDAVFEPPPGQVKRQAAFDAVLADISPEDEGANMADLLNVILGGALGGRR